MRVLYVESTVDHHSLPLANCLHDLLPEGQFAYASLKPLSDERRAIGWASGEPQPWMISAGPAGADAAFQDWWQNADIVLCAPKLYGLMELRIRRGTYVFSTSERWFKPPIGKLRLLHPPWALKALKFRRMARKAHMHYLAIGTYAASDIHWFCPMPGRLWSWGYFTSTSTNSRFCPNGSGFRVLWAGRMVNCKRVDTLIQAFSRLLNTRGEATLTLVGVGPEKNRLARLAAKTLPRDTYAFLPAVPPTAVREYMRSSHVYVLPSNGCEGWGAAVGEAMAEGCPVVASKETGAAKTLIRDRVNGMVFQHGDEQRLADILCELAADHVLWQRLAEAGKKTIDIVWSPASAAQRFLSVADALLTNRRVPVFREGPMQRL